MLKNTSPKPFATIKVFCGKNKFVTTSAFLPTQLILNFIIHKTKKKHTILNSTNNKPLVTCILENTHKAKI